MLRLIPRLHDEANFEQTSCTCRPYIEYVLFVFASSCKRGITRPVHSLVEDVSGWPCIGCKHASIDSVWVTRCKKLTRDVVS